MHKSQRYTITLIIPPQFEPLWGDNLTQTDHYNYYRIPPYGAGVIAAALKKAGHAVTVVDCLGAATRIKQKYSLLIFDYWDQVKRILKKGRGSRTTEKMLDILFADITTRGSDLIGFSIPTFGHFLFAVLMARRIREKSEVPIVFGGTFITLFADLYPEVLRYVDYFLIGDGYDAFPRLVSAVCSKEDISSDIPNLFYRDRGKTHKTQFHNYDLEEMPLPDFDEFDLDLYKNASGALTLPFHLSRGCKHACGFCIRNPVDYKCEYKRAEKAVSDLKYLRDTYKCYDFQLCDSNSGSDRGLFMRFLDAAAEADLGIHWRGYIGICEVDRGILQKMKDAGCDSLMFGIETGSDRILRMIRKPQHADQSREVLRLTKEAGLETSVSLMTGYPHETEKDIQKSLDFFHDCKKYIDYCVVRTFTLIYGTDMYNNPENYGITNLKPMESRYMFTFDEIDGMKWRRKKATQREAKKRIGEVLLRDGY